MKGNYGWLALCLLLWPLSLSAQRYPELSWQVIETRHCRIYYHRGAQQTAWGIAAQADEVVEKLFTEYGETPRGPFRVVVRDSDDIANASAYYGPGLIDFYASGSLFALRGRRPWLRGTFVHEFSHLVSLRINASSGPQLEGLSFGGLEDRFTKAHLSYGGSLYWPTNIFWRWWAEGVAQYDAAQSGFDPWDSHREMLLRTSFLEDRLLSYDEVHSILSSEDFGGELVYNQGFSFLRFLENRFGDHFRLRLARHQSRKWYGDADAALERLTDVSPRQLWQAWQQSLASQYRPLQARLAGRERRGQRVDLLSSERPPEETLGEESSPQSRGSRDGLTAFYPRLSPDRRWLAYVDQGLLHLLYLEEKGSPPLREVNKEKGRPPALRFSFTTPGSYYAFHPTEPWLVVSKQLAQWDNRYAHYDLWKVDLAEIRQRLALYEEQRAALPPGDVAAKAALAERTSRRLRALSPPLSRLTRRARATHPVFTPDGAAILFSQNEDGCRSLMRLSLANRHIETLLAAAPGGQWVDAVPAPDGKSLLAARFGDVAPGIWRFDLEARQASCFLCGEADNRDPAISADGERVYFSSDRGGGIFNLYAYEPRRGTVTQLTDLMSGAFHPWPLPGERQILYSDFTASGYKIALLTRQPESEATAPEPPAAAGAAPPPPSATAPPGTEKPYRFEFLPPRLQPILLFEDQFIKGGLGLQFSDVLRQHLFDFSFLFGNDTDLFAQYTNRVSFLDLKTSFQRFYRRTDVALKQSLPTTREYRLDHYRIGLTLPLFFRQSFSGWHNLGFEYHRKDFHVEFGTPVNAGGTAASAFPLLTDDRLQVQWDYSSRYDSNDPLQDICPRGRRLSTFRYSYVRAEVNPALSPDPALATSYDHFHQLEGSHREFLALPYSDLHALELSAQGGWIDRNVDPLEQLYAGGRVHFRPFGHLADSYIFLGYPDFSLSAEALLLNRLAYHFPLFSKIHRKGWGLYLDSLFASVFGEVGNFWTYARSQNALGRRGHQFLADVGVEIRLKAFLFSDYNRWHSVLQAAYGLQDNAAHGFRDDDWPLRLYFGVGVEL